MSTHAIAAAPRDTDPDEPRDLQPDDIWTPGTVRHGPNHLAHAGHRDREATR